MAGYDDSIDIEIVEFCVADDPFERAAAIFDCRGSERDRRHAIFGVDDVPSTFEVGEELGKGAGTITENPAAAVDVDQGGDGLFGRLISPEVELEGIIVLHAVQDVRIDDVVVACDFAPTMAIGTLGLCLGGWAERN